MFLVAVEIKQKSLHFFFHNEAGMVHDSNSGEN